MIVPDGEAAADDLSQRGHALEFLKDQYRHCKPILLIGAAGALLDEAGIPADAALGRSRIRGCCSSTATKPDAALPAFIAALTKHRHFERETDPPRV